MTTGDTPADGGESGLRFDVAVGDVGSAGEGPGPAPTCHVVDGLDAVPSCTERAPPNSFDPEVQWAWDGMGDESDVVTTPLVANLTDDNSDGMIDLCDVPDIVVLAYPHTPCFCCETSLDDCGFAVDGLIGYATGHVYVLDGASGALHARFETPIDAVSNPALADLDGDGVPEILALRFTGGSLFQGLSYVPYRRLVAFAANGSVKWEADEQIAAGVAISVADLDNDGHPEVLSQGAIFSHEGAALLVGPDDNSDMGHPSPFFNEPLSTAADLDGDGDLELVVGNVAYHHDGTIYYDRQNRLVDPPDPWVHPGIPQVADVDADGLPEIVAFGRSGSSMYVLEHDGTVKFSYPVAGFGPTPAAIHDIDGDGAPEVLSRAQKNLMVHDFVSGGATLAWNAPVEDLTGAAAGTAFDFLGDGSAEAIYADETYLWVFGPNGTVEIAWPRGSWTAHEFPVVADVDNDGSAEIVVVSNGGFFFTGPHGGKLAPAVQVIRDRQDRWVGARRIWNQHTYHVTNVREDGTIPQFEPPHWRQLNTFRTQAQRGETGVCRPEPAG